MNRLAPKPAGGAPWVCDSVVYCHPMHAILEKVRMLAAIDARFQMPVQPQERRSLQAAIGSTCRDLRLLAGSLQALAERPDGYVPVDG